MGFIFNLYDFWQGSVSFVPEEPTVISGRTEGLKPEVIGTKEKRH